MVRNLAALFVTNVMYTITSVSEGCRAIKLHCGVTAGQKYLFMKVSKTFGRLLAGCSVSGAAAQAGH